jgi:hypothetical protein
MKGFGLLYMNVHVCRVSGYHALVDSASGLSQVPIEEFDGTELAPTFMFGSPNLASDPGLQEPGKLILEGIL